MWLLDLSGYCSYVMYGQEMCTACVQVLESLVITGHMWLAPKTGLKRRPLFVVDGIIQFWGMALCLTVHLRQFCTYFFWCSSAVVRSRGCSISGG